jgi:hypothetical protein
MEHILFIIKKKTEKKRKKKNISVSSLLEKSSNKKEKQIRNGPVVAVPGVSAALRGFIHNNNSNATHSFLPFPPKTYHIYNIDIDTHSKFRFLSQKRKWHRRRR